MSMITEEIQCAHCTLPVPAGLVSPGDAEQFCCPGCRAVYTQIHACGLEDYYRFRDAGELSPHAAIASGVDLEPFDSPDYADLYVRREGDRCTTELALEGVTCAACVWLVERLPTRLPGLIEARLTLTDNTVRIAWDPTRLALSQIASELLRFGYRPHPARGVAGADLFRRELRGRLVDLGAAGAIAGNLMLLGAGLYSGWISGIEHQYEQLFRYLSLGLGLLSLLWPGREFFRGAITSIRLRTVNFDFPIAIALLTGGVAGTVNVLAGRGEIYFDSLAALIFLLLVGRLIQFCQQRRARGAVELLFSLTPSTCRVVDADAHVRSVPIGSLKVSDVVEVRAEELFPADGVVLEGASTMDASMLTGESVPVTIATGDRIFGGARNAEATVRAQVTSIGESTRVGRLMRLLEQGLAEKPPIVRLTDRVAARFTFVVLSVAAVTFACWWRFGLETAITTTVSLLIVTCPCVLGLAVPMTFALSIGRLARRGILVKSAAALERLARGGRLVFDKTGTLTEGKMRVVEWMGDPKWQGVVGEIERDSTHPVGRALRQAYEACEAPATYRLKPATTRTRTGGGIVADINGRHVAVGSPGMMRLAGVEIPAAFADACTAHEAAGRTIVLVAEERKVEALIALADTPRADAARTVEALRRLGFRPEICSGDTQGAVNEVAAALGIDPAISRGSTSPEEKLANVRRHSAVMIGDGVNDAAALAAADVGIAVAGGAEAALAAADVYIAKDGLAGVVELVETARYTLAIVHRNVLVATSYNVLAGALAVAGLMHPLMAAILMPLSSATVLTLTVMAARRGPKGERS